MILPDWTFFLALFVMLVGLAGTVLPGVPGLGLIWLVALIYAIAERFASVDPITFAALTLLAALGMGADYLLGLAVGRMAGASWQALAAGMAGGAVGFVLGLFVGGVGAVPAGLIGTLVGIIAVEYRRRQDLWGATKVSGGWLVGCLIGRGLQLAVGLVMIALFAWQAGWRGVR
jgi:uncharacterized protein YqgC (DUF456 family)